MKEDGEKAPIALPIVRIHDLSQRYLDNERAKTILSRLYIYQDSFFLVCYVYSTVHRALTIMLIFVVDHKL